MKILTLIVAAIILSGNSITDQKDSPKDLLIESAFYPSFHLPVKLKLHKSGADGYLIFMVLDIKDKSKIIIRDSVRLGENDFINFFKKLHNTSLLKIPSDTMNIGNDGITLSTEILQDGQAHQFRSWSPARDNFLDAIFDLTYSKFPKQEKYIENIQAYFNYGLPVKIKSVNPFIAKFYGSISIDLYSDLQKFFKKVPKRKKAILDMTNFWGMGTVFNDDFEEFDLSHPKLIWVIPNDKKYYFKNIGLDTAKMIENLELAIASN